MYADAPKTEMTFMGFRCATKMGDQQYIKANTKYFAIAVQGGGNPIAVVDHSKPGRVSSDLPVFAGHTGAITDFAFNPFNEQVIASCSEDQTVKIWNIPEGGLTETCTTAASELSGHERKPLVLSFHTTADNVLSSGSQDGIVKLWDIEKGTEMSSLEGIHEDAILDIVWDYTGNQYATSCKDKTVRVIDARSNTVATEAIKAHEGSKAIKLTYAGRKEMLVSVGFTKSSQRELKIWDPRNMGKALKVTQLDTAPGIVIPYYDTDTDVLFLAGKGDGSIRYFEIQDDEPYSFDLSMYRSNNSNKGMCFMPKRGCNVMGCEMARAFKLTQSSDGAGVVEPLSFVIPRKSAVFQKDIFPPTCAGVPSHTADEWMGGSNAAPLLVSLDPKKQDEGPQKQDVNCKAYVAPKSALEQAQERIAVLEKLLKDNSIDVP